MKTLKDLRNDYNLTQEELAELFEVSSRTIHNMEKDSSSIKESLLSKYIAAFNVKYDEIFLGNECQINAFSEGKKQSVIESFKQLQKV